MAEPDVDGPAEERLDHLGQVARRARRCWTVEAFEHLFERELLDAVAGRIDVGAGVVFVEWGLHLVGGQLAPLSRGR